MKRFTLGFLGLIGVAGLAPAHFYFVLPPDSPDQLARVVLSDTPSPDPTARVDAAAGRFWLLDAAGKPTPASVGEGGEGWAGLATTGGRTVVGTVEYGVVVRGQPEAVLVVHQARAELADVSAGGPVPAARPDAVLEVRPVARPNGLAFAVTASGKPVGAVEVVVYAPDEKRSRVVKTDAAGVTPAFDRPGRYAARATVTEAKAGEFQGRAYVQVRQYATVVVKFAGGR